MANGTLSGIPNAFEVWELVRENGSKDVEILHPCPAHLRQAMAAKGYQPKKVFSFGSNNSSMALIEALDYRLKLLGRPKVAREASVPGSAEKSWWQFWKRG